MQCGEGGGREESKTGKELSPHLGSRHSRIREGTPGADKVEQDLQGGLGTQESAGPKTAQPGRPADSAIEDPPPPSGRFRGHDGKRAFQRLCC